MRYLCALFLIVLITALGVLSYENNRDTTLQAWNWKADVPLPALVFGVYLLGMISGWWVLGLMKRSWQRATEPDRARA